MSQSGYLKKFLLEYAPDFCWMNNHDIFLMVEEQYPEIDWFVFKVVLCKLTRAGHFITKPSPYPHRSTGPIKNLYLRVDKSGSG